VLDVKCGDGAFMKSIDDARALARSMVAIGTHAGVRTEAFITDMEAPLGCAIGNALEIAECIDLLCGRGPRDLLEVVTRLASRMVILGGIESDETAARRCVEGALASGRARDTFARMIRAQGGDPGVVETPDLLPRAPDRATFEAPSDGYVTAVRASALGRANNALGAGRSKVGEPIDPAVGLVQQVVRGARVTRGQPLIELHHRGKRGLNMALECCRAAVTIGLEPPAPRDKLLDEVR
jgi:pyrimidine-nucleoside phosphorylase/thymidine phosphorylase